ncbi:putative gustatory receptor 93b [Drosophila rhopaloa]|uniref:Uncharacterized protein n=1 Tax=Drosophila rhopaloa TaxID=1041015 RepID=A0ABM5J6Q5_DRORH|nr:putative gustatory receptor 93b [Drosophila rhopaloa]
MTLEKIGYIMFLFHLVLLIPSYLSMIILQIFHGPEVVKLVNRYIELFHRVRSLSFSKEVGFGGGRQLVLVLLFIVKPKSKSLGRLTNTMILLREISCVIKSFQDLTNGHLFFSLVNELFLIVAISYQSIIESKYIQDLTIELLFAAEQKEWNQTVEVFVTHLNLRKLRVRPLLLFDVSNELFLLIFAGVVNYLVFIMQIKVFCESKYW